METGNPEKVMQGKTCSLCIRLDIDCPQLKSASCHQFPSVTLGHSFNGSAPQLLTCKMRMLIQLFSIPQSTLPTQASGSSALRLFLINYFPSAVQSWHPSCHWTHPWNKRVIVITIIIVIVIEIQRNRNRNNRNRNTNRNRNRNNKCT